MPFKNGNPGCGCCCVGTLCVKVFDCGGSYPLSGATVAIRLGSSSGTVVFTDTTDSTGIPPTCYGYAFSSAQTVWISVTPPAGSPFQSYGQSYTLTCANVTTPIFMTVPTGFTCCNMGASSPAVIYPVGSTTATLVDTTYGTVSSIVNGGTAGPLAYAGCVTPFCGPIVVSGSTGLRITYSYGCNNTGENPCFGDFGLSALYTAHGASLRCPGTSIADQAVMFSLTSYSYNMLQFDAVDCNINPFLGNLIKPLYPSGAATVTITW